MFALCCYNAILLNHLLISQEENKIDGGIYRGRNSKKEVELDTCHSTRDKDKDTGMSRQVTIPSGRSVSGRGSCSLVMEMEQAGSRWSSTTERDVSALLSKANSGERGVHG